MLTMSFENVMLPAEFYRNIVKTSVSIIVFVTVIMVVLSFAFRMKVHNSLVWYIQMPKIIVSLIAVAMVFCVDYETKKLCMPHIDNMLLSTFLVGVLAIIELLSSFATIIIDICNIKQTKQE